MAYSIIETAKANGLTPYKHLLYIFKNLPGVLFRQFPEFLETSFLGAPKFKPTANSDKHRHYYTLGFTLFKSTTLLDAYCINSRLPSLASQLRIIQIHDEIVYSDPEHRELGEAPQELMKQLNAKLTPEDQKLLDRLDCAYMEQMNRQDELLYSEGLMDGILFGYWVALIGRGVEKIRVWLEFFEVAVFSKDFNHLAFIRQPAEQICLQVVYFKFSQYVLQYIIS
jgi:hypothetical protein